MTPSRKQATKSRPFGWPATPFDPRTGAHQPLGDVRVFQDVTVVAAGHDALLCEDGEGRGILIAKPGVFRKSVFDGETFGGTSYASVGLDSRSATNDDAAAREEIVPAYQVGETIVARRRGDRDRAECAVAADELAGIDAGTYKLDWEDMNAAGRRWEAGASIRAKVTAVEDNTLTVKLLEDCTEAGAGLSFMADAEEFTVWKPWELQRQAYDGETLDGVAYSYVGEQERTSTLDAVIETEIVIPRYFVGAVIYVSRVPGGAAPGGPPERLIDENRGARAWAAEFVEEA